MQTESIMVGGIQVGARKRTLLPETVKELAQSISELGLRTPLTVRILAEAPDENGVICSSVPILVSGHHRLEAVRQLGWETVPCFVLEEEQEREARMWEIAENLHRADLSAVERAEHIDEWRKLTLEKVPQVAAPAGGRQPRDRGHNKTAEALGISDDAVRRSEKIASLPEAVRDQARAEGWSQERLLDEAKQQAAPPPDIKRNEEKQREREERIRLTREAAAEIARSASADFAAWLLQKAGKRERPMILSWLECAKPKDVSAALSNLMAEATA